MALKILIIHESRVISKIIQDYLFTDHPDAQIDHIDVPAFPEKTILTLEKTYDLVFSGMEMKGYTGLDIKNILQGSSANSHTPLIIMTPTDTPGYRKRLMQNGVKYILPIPCTSTRFRQLIYKIFNPAPVTGHTLYAIPDSRVVIFNNDKKIPGKIIDISTDSITCKIEDYLPKELEKAQKAIVQFPADYGKASTISISGDLAGFKDLFLLNESSSRSSKITWKIKWNLFELHAATKKTLQLYLGRVPVSSFELLKYLEKFNKNKSRSHESKIDILSAENKVLHEQISKLRKKYQNLKMSVLM